MYNIFLETLCTSMSMVQNHSSVLMHVHANYHPETVKKLSSTADCSFISSLAVDGFTMHVIEWSAILNTK